MLDHLGRKPRSIPFWQLARPIFLGAAMAMLIDSDSETAAANSGSVGPTPAMAAITAMVAAEAIPAQVALQMPMAGN